MSWVDISEAAFTLGVSERTIRNWIKTGKLEARNMGGRREVEIPDPGDGPTGQAFAEDEDSSQPLETQKRLEVALIECGRVKGTLASQERMMETLSSNIAELNAKIQSRERIIGRRTLWIVVVSFIGALTTIFLNSTHTSTVQENQIRHGSEKAALIDTHSKGMKEEREAHKSAMASERQKLEEQRRKDLESLHKQLKEEHDKQVERLLSIKNQEIADQKSENETLRRINDDVRSGKVTAEAELKATKKQLSLTEKLLEDVQLRVAELEKTRRELEKANIELEKKAGK